MKIGDTYLIRESKYTWLAKVVSISDCYFEVEYERDRKKCPELECFNLAFIKITQRFFWRDVKFHTHNSLLPTSGRVDILYKSGEIRTDRPFWALTFSEYPLKFISRTDV